MLKNFQEFQEDHKIRRNYSFIKEILTGKYDDLPEEAFLYVGTIEDVIKKAEKLGYTTLKNENTN